MATLSDDDVAALVKAASDAARAAGEAVTALRDQQASRSALGGGFHEASKVVRQPEPFGSENHEDDLAKWQDFNVTFKAWLFYGNKHFEVDLHRVEVTHADTPIANVDGEPQEVQDRCHQLYSILTGMLRGKPLRLLRQVSHRNGFEVWRQLSQLFMPRTKSRAISILAALMNIPSFTLKDRTLLDQVLGLERLRTEYVRSSGVDLPDDIMLSVLVKALPKAIQQHVQLQLNESSTYNEVTLYQHSILAWCSSWTPSKIHSELGILPQSSSSVSNPNANNMGPAPMEIDRFEKGKGKGKSKGKQKGKDNPKGKGKSKSDKGKGKPGKGSTRTATSSDQCLYCGKYGHFKRDCWKLHGRGDQKNVNQVESNAANSGAASSSASTTSAAPSSSAAGASSSVRLFTAGPIIEDLDEDLELRDLTAYDSFGACNMFSQVSPCSSSEWFDLDLDDTALTDRVYTERCSHFDMTYTDHDDMWTCCEDVEQPFIHEPNTVCTSQNIRAVGYSNHEDVEVVLDSGADGSVLPLAYGDVGYADKSFDGSKFIDAQGKPIQVKGVRIAEVRFGSVVFRERFIIAAVTSPLILMGRLLKDGWLLNTDKDGKMSLVRKSKQIPVHFKRNSLCAVGAIRMLSTDDPSFPSSPSHVGQHDATEHVRALTLGRALSSLGAGWVKLDDLVYAIKSNANQHIDTTLCPSDGANKPVVEVITIAHTSTVPPEVLGSSLHDDDVVIAPRSGIPLRVLPPAPRPEADEVPAAAEDAEPPVPERSFDLEHSEVIVDGVKLDSTSLLKTLRTACETLGLATGGSKKKCLKRIWDHLQSQEMIAAHGAEQQLRGDLVRPAIAQHVPPEPTESEIAEHNLTHHPYASWCELCISNRAQQDGHPVRRDEPAGATAYELSVRRLPKPWDMEMIGAVEASPWQFGYASLGSQLQLAKRISAPPILKLPPARPRDLDAEAVMNLPPSPDDGGEAPRSPKVVGPPSQAAPVLTGEALDEAMDELAEAGNLPSQVGLGAPSTPIFDDVAPTTPPDVAPAPSSATGSGDVGMSAAKTQTAHARDDEPGERPPKHPRIFAVMEHEDDSHPTYFENDEIDDLEVYDYELDDEHGDDDVFMNESVSAGDDVLQKLSVPYTKLEPNLPPDELLKLDLLADELEISRLKDMGVLLPAETFAFGDEVPKKLTTRMVRAWRDKFVNGVHVWLRRSRYVAREFAWLSPEREDLFSPASSVLTVRLLPTLFMKWKSSGYVLCAIDITDAFLMVTQEILFLDESYQDNETDHRCGTNRHPMLDEPDTTAKLNSADASVYRFAVGDDVEIRVHLAMDNSAGRTKKLAQPHPRIRHISLKVLWVQSKVKEGFMSVGKVSTKSNPSDLGTKRLTRERMEFLMHLCKVYDMSQSSFVGSEIAQQFEEHEAMKQGIKNVQAVGFQWGQLKVSDENPPDQRLGQHDGYGFFCCSAIDDWSLATLPCIPLHHDLSSGWFLMGDYPLWR
eukprot:s303_g24.t1